MPEESQPAPAPPEEEKVKPQPKKKRSRKPQPDVVESDIPVKGIARTMRNVVFRQSKDGPLTDKSEKNPVLDVLDVVVQSIKHGKDMSKHKDDIARLITNQEERAELIDSITLTNDYERYARFLRAREVLEHVLLRCLERDDLAPNEAMAFLTYVNEEAAIAGTRVRAGATSVKDVLSLLGKVDYVVQQNQSELEKKFSKTTPQGREVIRRLTHKLSKVVGGRPRKEVVEE